MEQFLMYTAIIMLIAVIGVFINEKIFRMPAEIALLIFSLLIGCLFKVLLAVGVIPPLDTFAEDFSALKVDELLMDAMLCFMLFSGSSDLKYHTLRKHLKPIALLALLTTAITAVLYGALLWGLTSLFGLHVGFDLCVLCGAIVSPTDPIAATGILSKLGLPDDLVAVMSGESLFNDGTGVALFIFVKGIVTDSSEQGFLAVMAKELLGAILLGGAIAFLCSIILKRTQNQIYHIMISICAVAASYTICEACGCSGVIASVVCGIYFATVIDHYREVGILENKDSYYDHFWMTIDKLLNYVLYILIGVSFISVVRVDKFGLVLAAAVVFNLASRYAGVWVSSLFLKQIPGGYRRGPFTTLMTWSGLKGGLSLALAMSISSIVSGDVYESILFIVFMTVIFTTIVQGLTVARLYLGLEKKKQTAR